MQDAQRQLQQFARTIQQMTDQMRQFGAAFQQATQQQQQAMIGLRNATQGTQQTFQQLNQQLNVTQQAFTQNITVVQHFNTSINQSTTTLNNLHAQLNQVNTSLNQGQQAGRGFGSVWSNILQIAGGIGLATSIQAITSAVKAFAVESLQAATRMENLRAQFTAFQGAAQGAVTLQNIFNTAQRLGVEFVSLADRFRQFNAATQGTALEGARAQRVFEQITTGARAMGASSEQTGRALLALQQMISKGVVSQEELRQQLGEALPGAMNIAARAFGVTTQEMNKMVEKGMDAVQFVQIFGAQVEREFAGKAATATNTLTSAWQRFNNELEQLKASLAGDEVVAALRDLVNWSTKLLENMRGIRELRQEALGGPAPVIPAEMAGMTTLQARQKEIEALRHTLEIGQRGFAYPGEVSFFGGMPTAAQLEEARSKLLELQKIQREAIQRIQEQWQAEGEQMLTAAMLPGARVTEAIRKRYEEGLKELRALDATAAFVTPLELAEEKAKAWHKVMQDIRQEAGRIGEGMRPLLTPTGKTTPFDDLLTRIAGEKGLDPNLMRALIEQESGFDPQARSRAGAMGLMQLMPGTARQYGAGGREFEPEANLRAGMSYFADLLKQFNGNIEKALTAYNAGPGRGGIPLPTGENATFAQDVLRRMPQGAGGLLAAGQRMQEALKLGVEAETPDRESLARIRATGQEYLRAIDEQERQLDADARDRLQQVRATGREYLRGLDEEMRRRDQAVESLKRLEQQYSMTANARKEDQAATIAAQFPQDEEIQTRAENVRLLIEEREAMESSFNAIKARTDAQREANDAAETFLQRMRNQLDLMQAPRQGQALPWEESREEIKLRQQAAALDLTEEQRAQVEVLRQQMQAQRQLNYGLSVYYDLAGAVGSAWTNTLTSIADGTTKVGDAFKSMAKSIMQSLAQIASQRAFDILIRIGAGLLTAAFTGGSNALGGTVGFGAAGGSGGGGFIASQNIQSSGTGFIGSFQGGGVITKPTLAYIGEGASHTLPEYILNKEQMNSLLHASAASGGQGGGVTVINYTEGNRDRAEQTAARERALGRQTVLNYVMEDLGAGEGSRIGRVMRTLSR